MSAERQFGPTLARRRRADGAGDGGGSTGGGAELGTTRDGWFVGAAARGDPAGRAAGGRRHHRGDLAPRRRGGRGGGGAVAAGLRTGAAGGTDPRANSGRDQRRGPRVGALSCPDLDLGQSPALRVSSLAGPGRRVDRPGERGGR